jgi:Pyruvate/2-oxoacid:ferredoxin oxidoreductase delta subunit
MAHMANTSGYHDLVRRLNKFPQGAPPSVLLFKILGHLFSEKEARLVSLLPIKVFSAEKAARAWKMNAAHTQKTLDDLCRKALLVDIRQNGRTVYCLPPPMAGFFEFSMMRIREDVDQPALADLLYRYINVEEDFAEALFAQGDTRLGRAFVREPQIPEQFALQVLDHERASHVIATAGAIGVSLCYCRHKMAHLDRACDNPQDICMTFNISAASLIRHGHARRVDRSEALELLQTAYAHHLVQFGENVRREVNFICHCCKCCCEAMIAARRFAMFQPVQTTNFIARSHTDRCSGCGQCASVCPVDAITLLPALDDSGGRRKRARVDTSLCLGCGVCAQVCPAAALAMTPRPRRVVTPLNTAHRVVLMAVERNTLQHLIFDNQILYSHRALATLLGVILRLPPLKRALAGRQLGSRYLETLIERLKWQPSADYERE